MRLRISAGTPGSMMTRPGGPSIQSPGAVPQRFRRTAAPSGTSAWLRLLAAGTRPMRANRSTKSAHTWSSNRSGIPNSPATACLLRSSRVGPRPPVVSTAPVRASASATADRMASGSSPTLARRTTCAPTAEAARASSAPFVSTVNPSSSSVPMVSSSMFMSAAWIEWPRETEGAGDVAPPAPFRLLHASMDASMCSGKQPPIPVDVEHERVDGEQGRDGERHGDKAAVELVPVVGIAAVFPAHGLPRIAKREPEDDGADEDVLDGRFELARAGRRDHHPSAPGPESEGGHGDLASDQEDAHPKRNAAPDRNVVEVLPGTRDPVDRDQRGEQQQLVGNGVEHLAEVADLITRAGQVPVVHVADGGREKDEERDELRPIALDERKQGDDRGKADPDQRDDVRERPHAARYPNVLTTLLLIAFRVSKTPSPVSATASK